MPIQIVWAANAPPPDLDEAALRRALDVYLSVIDREGWELSLLFADDGALQELNRTFRGLDHPTDVLSWSYDDPSHDDPSHEEPGTGGMEGDEAMTSDGVPLLGELAISLERAETQALENGWARGVEVLRLLAHGCAHLAGYDHQTPEEEQVMLAVEQTMLAAAGVGDLYPESKGDSS